MFFGRQSYVLQITLTRTVSLQFFLIGSFFIARIDTPFLAPGVGRIGTMELDAFPLAFRKDVLMHEAHRHPFIETLGFLCLLQLRLGACSGKSLFGRNAHSCWRLLLVLALCPWLRKYYRGCSSCKYGGSSSTLENNNTDDDDNRIQHSRRALLVQASRRQLRLEEEEEEIEDMVTKLHQISALNQSLLQRVQQLEKENKELRPKASMVEDETATS